MNSRIVSELCAALALFFVASAMLATCIGAASAKPSKADCGRAIAACKSALDEGRAAYAACESCEPIDSPKCADRCHRSDGKSREAERACARAESICDAVDDGSTSVSTPMADCRWTAWIPSVSSGCACHGADGICMKRCTTTRETRTCSGAGHAPHSQEQNYHVECTGSCEP